MKHVRRQAGKVVISSGAKLWRVRVYDTAGHLMSGTEVGPGRWGPGGKMSPSEYVDWWAREYFPGVPVERT